MTSLIVHSLHHASRVAFHLFCLPFFWLLLNFSSTYDTSGLLAEFNGMKVTFGSQAPDVGCLLRFVVLGGRRSRPCGAFLGNRERKQKSYYEMVARTCTSFLG